MFRNKNLQEMKNAEIQLHNAEEIRTGVRVFYSVVDDKGIADVKMVISEEKLLTYIADNDLCMFVTDEFNGDYLMVSAKAYLTGNLVSTVIGYLEENFLIAV